MLKELKQGWRAFRRERPGHRFLQRYERNRQARSKVTRFLKPVAGVVLLAAGAVFCVIPGPGLPLLLIGACFIADVSRPAASAMDLLEVQIRNVISWATEWWRHASKISKYAVILLVVFLTIGAAYGGYRIVMHAFPEMRSNQ